MYCPKCGTENEDGREICSSCSWVLASVSTGPLADAKTSGLAITALVLGILSFFTCYITAIPAIIFGIIALVKINKSSGRQKGVGMAIVGMALPATLLPVMAIIFAIMMPALNKTKGLAQRLVCSTNLRGLGTALVIYTNDYDDKLPTPQKWCDLLISEADVAPMSFRCKGAQEGPCNYAMNKNLIDNNMEGNPADMVMLFETVPGWNQVGGPDILTTENHRGEGCNIVFADGHTEFVRTEDIDSLKWTVENNIGDVK